MTNLEVMLSPIKRLLYLSIFSTLIFSCKSSYVEITDEYIDISKPGQQFGIIEIVPTKMDTTFGYPDEYNTISGITLVDRNTHKQIDDNAKRKIYFLKRDKRYCWQIADDPTLAEYRYSDTIHLKPKTWYTVVIERTTYDKYFYWNGTKGDFIIKSKPRPGAW